MHTYIHAYFSPVWYYKSYPLVLLMCNISMYIYIYIYIYIHIMYHHNILDSWIDPPNWVWAEPVARFDA